MLVMQEKTIPQFYHSSPQQSFWGPSLMTSKLRRSAGRCGMGPWSNGGRESCSRKLVGRKQPEILWKTFLGCFVWLHLSSFDMFWSSRIFGSRQFDGHISDARKVGHMRLFQKWFKEQWNSWASHAPAPRLETSASAKIQQGIVLLCPILCLYSTPFHIPWPQKGVNPPQKTVFLIPISPRGRWD